MIDLRVKIGDLLLKNPVLVASGTFGYGQESGQLTNLNDLGGIVTKSISLNPRAGNLPPRICELPAGMLNSIGLANVGLKVFVEEKLPFLQTLDTSVIVNIAGSTDDEFLRVVQALNEEEGIDAYELNFSCPNVREGGLGFSQDARVTARVTELIRQATKRPLLVKLTPNVTKISDIARAAADHGADAVSLINTLVGMAVDVTTRKPKIHAVTAGYSGPAIKPIALAKIYEVRTNVNIPIVGIGGIMNMTDALEFFITGASAIQIGTANFIDPSTGPEIAGELKEYFANNHIKKMAEIVGTLQVG